MRGKNFTKGNERRILDAINRKVGDELDVNIKYVPDIEPTKAGKSVYLKQNLDFELY